MHTLGRHVRFSVNPFLDQDAPGHNAFASKPAGEGLAIFLDLLVELTGPVRRETGFIVNVTEIDERVRGIAAPVLAKAIRTAFRQGEHVSLAALARMLASAHELLAGEFEPARVSRLTLQLNPHRKIAMDGTQRQTVYFGEKFEFAATHTLWNEALSQEQNVELFGRCANRSGHGHNYVIEVTVKLSTERKGFSICQFEKTVDEQLIALVDHRNLNVDLPYFQRTNPTVENIAVFAWEKLADGFGEGLLHCVTVWESERTSCSYYG